MCVTSTSGLGKDMCVKDDLSKVNVIRMKTLRLQRVQFSTWHAHTSGLREQELARMVHERSPWGMLTSTTGEGAGERCMQCALTDSHGLDDSSARQANKHLSLFAWHGAVFR